MDTDLAVKEPIDWMAPQYRQAQGGTLEHWQYLAACYIVCHVGQERERDALVLEVGRRCYEAYIAGTPSCIWHETSVVTKTPCSCAKCRLERTDKGKG